MSLTLRTMYSGGGLHAGGQGQRGFDAGEDLFWIGPGQDVVPHSIVSGRSVTSRSVTTGTPKMRASSWTVPLSSEPAAGVASRD